MTDDHGALTPSERKRARSRMNDILNRDPAEPAPRPEPVTVEAPPPRIPTDQPRRPDPVKPPAIVRPAVAADFAHTERTRLRVMALEFALRGGELLRARVGSGAEILSEAEEIERWIAAAGAEEPKP